MHFHAFVSHFHSLVGLEHRLCHFVVGNLITLQALQASLESFGPKKFALVREQQAQLQAQCFALQMLESARAAECCKSKCVIEYL